MCVHDRLVPMRVRMSVTGRILAGMYVLMMRIVNVEVLVLHGLVCVLVLVPLGDMKPHA